ncbi:MAG: O-methyltransferase [Flavobacteriales bacterium]|jgi:predicted O-methyltransferase YrrM|nr:MAG: O-methyltransferase [Flavobacteriales bacterium]
MPFLDPALERYAEANTAPEPDHLRELAAETQATTDLPNMLSGHVQGRFLSLLSHLVRPTLALEIGTFTGYSALCLAEGLAPDGILHTIDIFNPVAAMADRYFRKAGYTHRIRQHIAPALDVIPRIEGRFDLVFIDADKSNYIRYLDLVIDRMNTGGLIIADNVLWNGKVLAEAPAHDGDTRGLAAYARRVSTDERLQSVLLPLRDGLLVSRRK